MAAPADGSPDGFGCGPGGGTAMSTCCPAGTRTHPNLTCGRSAIRMTAEPVVSRRGPPASAHPREPHTAARAHRPAAAPRQAIRRVMADTETVFKPGLEGVIAFETEIAEPDKEGNALRYRGVDIEDLVNRISFGNVWGLLVDGKFKPGLPPAEPFPVPVHSGDIRVDVQSALATLAPAWGLEQLLDIDDAQARDDLARCSVTAMSFVAQAARGLGQPMVPQKRID